MNVESCVVKQKNDVCRKDFSCTCNISKDVEEWEENLYKSDEADGTNLLRSRPLNYFSINIVKNRDPKGTDKPHYEKRS